MGVATGVELGIGDGVIVMVGALVGAKVGVIVGTGVAVGSAVGTGAQAPKREAIRIANKTSILAEHFRWVCILGFPFLKLNNFKGVIDYV